MKRRIHLLGVLLAAVLLVTACGASSKYESASAEAPMAAPMEEAKAEERARKRAYSAKRYRERKEKGLCISCGKYRAMNGLVRCMICNDKENARQYRKRKEVKNAV